MKWVGETMKSRFWIIGIISISLFICLCLVLGKVASNKALAASYKASKHHKVHVCQLLKDKDYQWIQTNINSWATIEAGDLSIEKLEDMALEASDFFDLQRRKISTNGLESGKEVNLEGNDQKGLKYDIIISNREETFVIVNILDKRLFADTKLLEKKIQDYFHSLNTSPRISTILAATIEGRISAKDRESLIKNLIGQIQGEVTQTMEDDQLISLAGYSPILDAAPIDNINFQLASRYNSYRDKTYLWIGTPIITIEY